MSASMHPTMQQLADRIGVSRRLMFQAAAVHRYGCPELVKAAHSGVLAMKHCETLAKALLHDEQRKFLAELPRMSNRQRHDLLTIIKGDLTHRTRTAREAGKGALHG